MSSVPTLKKGHHREFSLTEVEIQDLILNISDKRTRAMVLLASLGIPMRGILAFTSQKSLSAGTLDERYPVLDIEGVTADPVRLTQQQYNMLLNFPYGFQVTDVTVWRRIKKELLRARKDGVLIFDDEHVPFPASLMERALVPQLSIAQKLRWCLDRIHSTQERLPNQDHGTPGNCPHKDCEKVRGWIRDLR